METGAPTAMLGMPGGRWGSGNVVGASVDHDAASSPGGSSGCDVIYIRVLRMGGVAATA
jgi:hypothetical protein